MGKRKVQAEEKLLFKVSTIVEDYPAKGQRKIFNEGDPVPETLEGRKDLKDRFHMELVEVKDEVATT